MLIIQNEKILDLIHYHYSLQDIQTLIAFLEHQKTLEFIPLTNGLFSAAVTNDADYTGYTNVWIRDNIHVAYAHLLNNQVEVAIKIIRTLVKYFQKYQYRFQDIIEGKVDKNEVMKRPHVRFNGEKLEEISQAWNHAQNDALGYFLWFYCQLVRRELLIPQADELEILALFPVYFDAIAYWQDEDSGHWEEDRKIEASSIGVVVAALQELQLVVTEALLGDNFRYKDQFITVNFLLELINKGQISLNQILPFECIQKKPKNRKYDAALLFLIYPLQIIQGEMAEKILNHVINHLQGNYGIRRYLDDTFWCRDYQDIPQEIRTTISLEREQWFAENNWQLKTGEEAQWCIFDSIISAIFGIKYQQTLHPKYLQTQTYYLNRSLGQLTATNHNFGAWRCPELYYLEKGHYLPGDATPLLWTQANLKIALTMMKKSLEF
ncbi:MAG: glycoside hydrolase family 15 protein [Cyanobacteria bacterium P01_G01_bin.49]